MGSSEIQALWKGAALGYGIYQAEEQAETVCFPAGTPVATANGKQPIETVKEGEVVASRDPSTGTTEWKKVVRTLERTTQALVGVEVADAVTGKAETLRGTPEHLVFTERGLVPMGELGIGTRILTRAGPELIVQSVRREAHPEGVTVHNFEVEGDHTYFVGDLDGGAWVHNDCGGMLGNATTRAQDEAIADELERLGWTVTHGGGRGKQLYLPDPSVVPVGRGRPVGAVFPDITAINGNRILHVQTVDTDASGWPTDREMSNLIKILQRRPNDEVIWIPK